jgi:hypothetical protein
LTRLLVDHHQHEGFFHETLSFLCHGALRHGPLVGDYHIPRLEDVVGSAILLLFESGKGDYDYDYDYGVAP